jgi:hypothetical protein
MRYRKLIAPVFAAGLGLATLAGALAVAEEPKPADAAAQTAAAADKPEMKLPPGWTEADMQACMIAATPGEQHKQLAADAGTWHGQNSMYMPGSAEAIKSESTTTITPIMDGRFIKVEVKGEMPGMGPFHGLGIYGYDNVAQKYVGTWLDSMGTGVAQGEGKLSPDGKTMTWTYSYHCPVSKKLTTMRQVEKVTGADTKTMEMFGADPKSGKEYKMMTVELTRKAGGQARAAK